MKLRTLAIAVAMASVSVAAQADVKISGDIGVRYMSNESADTQMIEQAGSEVNFDASEKVGGITYSAHAELEVPGGAMDEIRVGMSGGFGSVTIGDLGDNACGAMQKGGSFDVWLDATEGSCADRGGNGVIYSRGIGKMNMAISHRLEQDGFNTAESSIGLNGTIGPVAASIGYTSDTYASSVSTGNAAVGFGLAGTLGPIGVGFRYGKTDGSDAVHGLNLKYATASGINVYGGIETSDDNARSVSIGFKKVVGTTDFIFEAVDHGSDAVAATDSSGTDFAVGVRHRF